MHLAAGNRILGGQGHPAVPLGDNVRHLAFNEDGVGVGHVFLAEMLVFAGGTQIDVKDVNLGIRILRTDVGDMLEGRHAADVRAVLEVVLVTGTGTLDKGKRGGLLVVPGPEDLALGRAVVRGQALHHHVGDDRRRGGKVEVGDVVGIVGVPTGRPDDRTDLQREGLGLHVQIHRIVLAGRLDSAETFG